MPSALLLTALLAALLPDALPAALPDEVPDVPPDALPDELPDAQPGTLPDEVPDVPPDALPDEVPDALPDVPPDALPDAQPGTLPDALPGTLPGTLPDALPGTLPDELPDHPIHCAALRTAWLYRIDDYLNTSVTIQESCVRVDGEELTLEVWGAGGAERAAAGALLALVRALLGYRARLRPERARLCALARGGVARALAAAAPAAAWARGGCGAARAWALDEVTSLAAGAGAAAPGEPLLHARAPTAACALRAAEWRFYARGAADPSGCRAEFQLADDGGFAVFARNHSDDDARALAELQRRARAHAAPLALRTSASDPIFRKTIAELREQNSSVRGFLFVDDDIWADEPLVARVQPPPCAPGAAPARCAPALLARPAVRVGNGAFMLRYAPAVARLVSELELAPRDLRAVLHYEAQQRVPDVVEAACRWALDNVDSLFRKHFLSKAAKVTAPTYTVGIHPCSDDPDVEAHEAAAEYLRREVLWDETRADVAYSFEPVNCSDPSALGDAVARRADDARALAAVAWSAAPGAAAARRAAASARLPLLLVGAAPERDDEARAASGALAALARAFRHLLALCAWSRVAVLSDSSAYAQSFAELLLAAPALQHRAATLDARDVERELDALRRTDARVVVLNAAWPLAEAVLCGAARRGEGARRVWLLREARAPACAAAALRVLALGVSWRGGAARGGRAALREGLRGAAWGRAADALGPPLTAALVDALIQITLAADGFLHDRPSYKHDLRGSVRELSRYLDELNATGVAGNLEYDGHALKDPAVYVERWTDGRGAVAAVWRVTRGAVRAEWPRGAARCERVLGGARAPDRAACATLRAGDAFAPRCLDAPLFASVAFLLLGALALGLARRARRARRGRREREWRRRLDERRQRAASALGAFLVERGAIRLLHEIGAGCYGRVHFAELRRGGATLLVAAKEPRADAAPAEEGEFLREACVLARLRHAHVVRLLGVCVADGPPTVLLEHALHLDLQRYLAERRARGGRELAPRALTRLAREAAAALAYVAARRLVHRDVRAANCLVDARRSLKLADFGMARELGAAEPEYASRRRGLFPVLWMAPESLAEGVFSPASDVWALGVLLLELATLGARPYGRWAPARVLRFVTAGGRPPLPPDLAPDTRELVLRCWRRAPERRPRAASVARALAERRAAVRAALLPPLEPPDGDLHV